MKIKLVLHTVGKVLLLEAILMLLPLIVAVIYGEGDIAAFAISIAITAAAGLILTLPSRPTARRCTPATVLR